MKNEKKCQVNHFFNNKHKMVIISYYNIFIVIIIPDFFGVKNFKEKTINKKNTM